MIGRKTLVGLSLLCVLCFCALAASSASAANGTTAGECVEGGTKDFTDAHCDIPGPAGSQFGHVLFDDTTGTSTPWTVELEIGTVVTVIDCDINVTGSVTNSAGPPMAATLAIVKSPTATAE